MFDFPIRFEFSWRVKVLEQDFSPPANGSKALDLYYNHGVGTTHVFTQQRLKLWHRLLSTTLSLKIGHFMKGRLSLESSQFITWRLHLSQSVSECEQSRVSQLEKTLNYMIYMMMGSVWLKYMRAFLTVRGQHRVSPLEGSQLSCCLQPFC